MGSPEEIKQPDDRHSKLIEINDEVAAKVAEIIDKNYSGNKYDGPERAIYIQSVVRKVRNVLIDRTVSLDKLSSHFFTDNFTVEGIPVIDESDIDEIITKFPYLEKTLNRIAVKPGPKNRVPLNETYFGVNKNGKLRRMDRSTVALRSREYFCNIPDQFQKRIKEENSSMPILDYMESMIQEHGEVVNNILNDKNLIDVELTNTEVLALSVSFDHLRNYMLFFLNILLIIAKSADSPDILKGSPRNTYIKENDPRSSTVNTSKVYLNSVDKLLTSDASNEITDFMSKDYDEVMKTTVAFVEAYHGFIVTKDPKYLLNFDSSRIEFVLEKVIPKIRGVVSTFEGAVNEDVDPNRNKTRKDNQSIKREFFKKVLRHERDGDHPGINMASTLSHIPADGKKQYDLVCGMSYGGIEYPALYEAMQNIISRENGSKHGAMTHPKYGHIILSNYNLAFNPGFTPRLEHHIFPRNIVDDVEGKSVLILDDNIITGKTNTQVEVAFRAKGAVPQFAVCDLNTDPVTLSGETVLSTGLEDNVKNSVRPIGKRFKKKRFEAESNQDATKNGEKRHKLPDFLNASRYFS